MCGGSAFICYFCHLNALVHKKIRLIPIPIIMFNKTMKTLHYRLFTLALLLTSVATSVWGQERRPIDSQHPLWMIHIDVWNTADPQKIINLIPDDIKPYVCMNLSLSCQYDKERNVYKMPRCAVRTYKSWGTVCQQNGLWFTGQPASGGHTHIQDDDLETFEYFFKRFPNFLGWNYAEQFWGFDESGDKSSSTQASRIALFAKLVPMHHQYGDFLTVSFCGNIWSHGLNPMGMMKRNKALLEACKAYPEAILWLYKYTTSSCWYANESVTWGPYVSGLAKNYGVRYDNCGWNGALDAILGEGHGKKYPGAAGLGTVMEQTCMNGGAVWDGPELIWQEDFQNQNNSTVDGYTRRNWGTFPNFRGVWMDMFRKVIDGTMYIPTREEVVGKTKIVVINNRTGNSDEDKYAAWGTLYDGLYKQTDPFNRGNGQWMDNLCYFKKTGRYGTIPLVIDLYDDVAKSIPVQVKKSNYTSRWSTTAKKTADFNEQYPEVSKGDLFVERFKNQLVTYTPYTYLNKNTSATAAIPLLYNSCDTMELTLGKLGSGLVREYADHVDLYLNNYRNDTTTARTDIILIKGVAAEPSYKMTRHTSATSAGVTPQYDAEQKTFKLTVRHNGAVDVTIGCMGSNPKNATDGLAEPTPLPLPKQPDEYFGPVEIEAEDMDYKSVAGVNLSNSGWYFPDVLEYAGNGYVDMGTNKSGALRHQLRVSQGGEYTIAIRYTATTKSGNLMTVVNGARQTVPIEKTEKNDWHKATFTATLKEGQNNLLLQNSDGIPMFIDQIIYTPAGVEPEKFLVTIRDAEYGTVTSNVAEAAEGETVTLTVNAKDGYRLKELRVINSVYYTMAKTITVSDATGEVTFTMPDDNVTLLPVFTDQTAVYKLDFTSVQNGVMPNGWRTLQENNETHQSPNSYSSGARTMAGFTGFQGKGLYWRNEYAEYGGMSNSRLRLDPGQYKLTFVMAAWKESPKYKVEVMSVTSGNVIATSPEYTAEPNANGNASANVKSAVSRELTFDIADQGNYIIRFTDTSTGSGYHEFLLMECRLNDVSSTGIATHISDVSEQRVGIYSPSGIRRQSIQRGLNIVRNADGKSKVIMSM